MRKIRFLLISAILAVYCSTAFAVDATVTFVSGKVEVQRNGKWIALQKGDTVSKSETISTGFQSEAKIKIMESVMYLGPVTRITLEELSTTGQKDNVNIYLKTGTARSQVKHVDNKRVNYQVHTAVAVASCRGTGWIIDDSNNIDCFEGVIAVSAYKGFDEEIATIARVNSEKESDEKTDSTNETEQELTQDDGLADGILVKENQTVNVSDTSMVSVPVNAVVKAVEEHSGTVSTASDKEGLGGAGVTDAYALNAGNTQTAMRNNTATVVVVVDVPLD